MALTTLDVRGCKSLTRLPESAHILELLTEQHGTVLYLGAFSALTRVPESMGQLAALTMLDLRSCSSLTRLPESMGQLTALTTLNLSGCDSLTGLPESMGWWP